MDKNKPTVAVYKFSSCDGCQLSLLNMEDELLSLADAVDLAYFIEASRATKPGPYDIALVEGSVTTPHEIERIKEIRQDAKFLIALGTCATAGGVQALRNFADADEYAKIVYAHPEYLNYLPTATPIAEHVKVDLELWGCPVNKAQVIEVVVALLNNRKPNLPPYSVCLQCKRRGTICVLVDKGIPCLGPATHRRMRCFVSGKRTRLLRMLRTIPRRQFTCTYRSSAKSGTLPRRDDAPVSRDQRQCAFIP